jgi:tetratricopeptide (TPR) repeat protein
MESSRTSGKLVFPAVGLIAAAVAFGIVAPEYWSGDGFNRIARAEPIEQVEVVRRVARECPPEKRPGLLRRVADLDGGEGLATEMLLAVIESDPEHVDPVLEAYRRRFPVSPMVNAWTIEARLAQGRVDEAVRLHREALADLGGQASLRLGQVSQFARQMADADRAVEAYVAADPRDAEPAFRALAERLEQRGNLGEAEAAAAPLRALVAAREARSGPSAWTKFYAGLVEEFAGDDEAAQRLYAEAARIARSAADPSAGPPLLLDPERFLRRRLGCLVRLGRWEQAYEECGSVEEAFDMIGLHLRSRGRIDDLAGLVEQHRRRFPDSPAVGYWDAMTHWDRGEYAEAVALFDAHLRGTNPIRRYDSEAYEKKFRGLIRLDRLDEARAMLGGPRSRRWSGGEVWRMIVAAKEGDEAALGAMLEAYAAGRSDGAASAFADPDLGPLLRASGRFASLDAQAKAPPPGSDSR